MVPRSLLLAALLAAAALPHAGAQAPGVPQGGAACVTDMDCTLGGECLASVCVCDPWWTGANCALLNLEAPPDANQGLQVPN
jgi:hypothetical protein